jgi:hypothetical protein
MVDYLVVLWGDLLVDLKAVSKVGYWVDLKAGLKVVRMAS